MAVKIDWACEYCGYTTSSWADIVDEIQCPMCGEPVVPQANNGGGNRTDGRCPFEYTLRQVPT